jgi:hypothetical protein
MPKLCVKVRPPFSEIVIRIDDSDTRLAGRIRQKSERLRHREGALGKLISARKLETVDDVDQQEDDVRPVGSIAV